MLKTLITLLIMSIPIGDKMNVSYDKCDYAEINTFYNSDGVPNFRQIIFWEWRKGEVEDKETGVVTYQWGYAVKGWKRLNFSKKQIVLHEQLGDSLSRGGSNEYLPSKTKGGWYSRWVENKNGKPYIYHIDYVYITQTRTSYDPEQYNKKFVPNSMRTGFKRGMYLLIQTE